MSTCVREMIAGRELIETIKIKKIYNKQSFDEGIKLGRELNETRKLNEKK